jgi:phage shock protein PspC (stress-responsive transcriptional regulator)
MGQPEDYRIEGDNDEDNVNFEYVKRRRKLYRDTEKGMLGGVSTGLGHYFGIDAVWLRIMFLIFVFAGFGTGIVAYLILWIVTPAAVTTSEKLEMTGEPVTISNIEKKVREEFDTVSAKFKNADYDTMGRNVKTGAERFASNVGEVFLWRVQGFLRKYSVR